MSVAVITPFCREPEDWLRTCIDSVRRQTFPCTHVLVADGAETPDWLPPETQLIRLPQPHRDYGNLARAVGSASAIAQGFHGIAWLDGDNWYEPDHIESLWRLHLETEASICTSSRTLVKLNGETLGLCVECDGKSFVDTNCFLLTRAAFRLIHEWYLVPREQAPVGDRVFWNAAIRSGLRHAHSGRPTVVYRTPYVVHYRRFGAIPPEGAKPNSVYPMQIASPTTSIKVPFAVSTTQPSISLCMIVRNEQANLGACLKSIEGLVDEMVVVDTGSSDATKAIAERAGAKVIDFPWIDSFSEARNESLKQATCDWIFWMDADDRLDEANRDRFCRLREHLPEGNYVFMMKQRSKPDRHLASPLVVDHARVFRRQPNIGWKYRLHEQVLPSLKKAGAKMVFTDLVIDHLGYADPQVRRGKLDRNLRLLLLDAQEHPADSFVQFNLAGTFLDIGDLGKAMPHLRKCIESAPRGASFLPKAQAMLVQSLRLDGKLDEALEACTNARQGSPRNVELLFEEGLIRQARRDAAGALAAFETILKTPQGPQFVGTDEGVFGHLARHHLAMALKDLRQTAAAEDQWRSVVRQTPQFAPAWLFLMDLLLAERREEEGEALAKAAELSGNPMIAPVLQAKLLLSGRRPDLAIATLEAAVASAPDQHWVRLILSDVLERSGDRRRAVVHLRELLRLAPHHKQAQSKLNQLENVAGGKA